MAMALDDSLATRAAAAAAAAEREARPDGEGSIAGAAVWATSPSARFQTLLVHARRRDGLPVYYEAMFER